MSIDVIRLDNAPGPTVLHAMDLGPDLRTALLTARSEPGPVAFILREDDVSALDACKDLIIDRHRKHRAKPLAAILLGYEQMPLVRGGYSSPGQLLRSVRTLLERARESGDGNVFLIGADSVTFAELTRRARRSSATGTAQPREARLDAAPADHSHRASRQHSRALIDLLPDLPVPDSLVREFIGDSVEVRLVRQLIVRAAQQDGPVLILGDTGSGKEVVARLIHAHGPRRNFTFMPVNCGAIPRELLESELFGYEKGAHSTAAGRKLGLWRAADRGTLLLDEVADLTLDHQVKVLRAIDRGEIQPVGAEKPVKVDTRVVAATNRDLFAMMRAGEFREDLYYRLRAFMIRTPPLREHPGDIPALAQALWKQITRDPTNELPADIIRALQDHGWPGNVHDLKMFLTGLHGLFGAHGLRAEHLRAVFEFERQALAPDETANRLEDAGTYRIHCLRHLRQADEVLRAAQVRLRDVLKGRSKDPETLRSIADATDLRVNELEVLCAHPLLFHTVPTFNTVRRLKEKLRDFAEQLRQDPERALAFWKKELEPDFAHALTIVFDEVARVVKPT